MGIWARGILEGVATVMCPPRTREFNALLDSAAKRSKPHIKKKSKDESSDEEAQSRAKYPPPQIHFVQVPPPALTSSSTNDPTSGVVPRRRNSLPTVSPQKGTTLRPFTSLIAASSIGQFTSKEYNGTGLLAFLTWCTEKYGGDEYTRAYEKLREEGIGIDLLAEQDITADVLATKCYVGFGTALRILKSHPIWLATLSNSTS
jgi:hypothetical protein